MKTIVISAVNFTDGGKLATLKSCLEYLSSNLADKYEIVVLVNDKHLFDCKNINYYSFPNSKKSWLARLYYEYIHFWFFSKKMNPHLWFSLDDTTPNVRSDIRAVYALNPSPFYKLSLKEARLSFRFALFNCFYRYLYSININKNAFVVVQQDCIRDRFRRLTGVNNDKIVVGHPEVIFKNMIYSSSETKNTFFYPSFPRVFKNFEVVCKASEILVKKGIKDFQIIFTISGKENKYARYLFNSYKHIEPIKFYGIRSRDEVYELYNSASCVIFPSKLETWGLPITEAKLFKKPILLADLEYAHETLGTYDKVIFFNPDDAVQLADTMNNVINGTAIFENTEAKNIPAPFAKDWKELFDILLSCLSWLAVQVEV